MYLEELNAERKLKKAIINLQKKLPFIGYLGLRLKINKLEDDNQQCQTMGVDGMFNIYYNENFVNNVVPDFETLTGIMAHEILHIALNHLTRINQRNHEISNIAQDMVVNYICKECKFKIMELEGFVLVDLSKNIGKIKCGDQELKIENLKNKSWERVYDELYQKIEKSSKPETSGNDGNSDIEGNDKGDNTNNSLTGKFKKGFDKHFRDKFKELTKTEQDEIINNTIQAVADAYVQSKALGNLPGSLERYVKDILESKIPWSSKLLKYVKTSCEPKDFSYRKPHKKSYNIGIYLPNVKKESIEISIMVDISGSIGSKEYQEFISEVYHIMKSNNNIKAKLYFGDTKIIEQYDLKSSQIQTLLKIKLNDTGGGTDMEQCFKEIEKDNRKNNIIICLTDGYTKISELKPVKSNILWVYNNISSSKKPKYGELIKME